MREKINQIYKLNDELKLLIETESEAYKKATENRANKITLVRSGASVEATEAELWEEVRVAGLECEGGKILRKKYPNVFKIAIKREKKNKELHDYIQEEFGFSFRQMGVADYLKLTEAVIEAKFQEHEEK